MHLSIILVEVHQPVEIKSGKNRRSHFFGGVRQLALVMICYPPLKMSVLTTGEGNHFMKERGRSLRETGPIATFPITNPTYTSPGLNWAFVER